MENLKDAISTTTGQMQTSCGIPPKASPRNTPSRDEYAALFALVNRARALNGWKMQDEKTLEKRILLWWDVLRGYRIPVECYRELFDAAFDERQRQIGAGKDAKDWPIDAALLVSCWTRPHGLKDRVEQRRVDAGRTLSGNAESGCPRCFGTGLENVFDDQGKVVGVVAGRACDHRAIEEGEVVFKAASPLRAVEAAR